MGGKAFCLAAKEKLEIVLSAPVQGEAGGRGVWGEFRPPSPVSSVRIFSNRHRHIKTTSLVVFMLVRLCLNIKKHTHKEILAGVYTP